MSEAKWTPGPWIATELGVIADRMAHHGNFYVCGVINADDEEDKATMRLIAAAPELYEALCDTTAALDTVLAHYEIQMPEADKQQRNFIVAKARAAIAKAEAK